MSELLFWFFRSALHICLYYLDIVFVWIFLHLEKKLSFIIRFVIRCICFRNVLPFCWLLRAIDLTDLFCFLIFCSFKGILLSGCWVLLWAFIYFCWGSQLIHCWNLYEEFHRNVDCIFTIMQIFVILRWFQLLWPRNLYKFMT